MIHYEFKVFVNAKFLGGTFGRPSVPKGVSSNPDLYLSELKE